MQISVFITTQAMSWSKMDKVSSDGSQWYQGKTRIFPSLKWQNPPKTINNWIKSKGYTFQNCIWLSSKNLRCIVWGLVANFRWSMRYWNHLNWKSFFSFFFYKWKTRSIHLPPDFINMKIKYQFQFLFVLTVWFVPNMNN